MRERLFDCYEAQGNALLSPKNEQVMKALHEQALEIIATSFILPFERTDALRLSFTAVTLHVRLSSVYADTAVPEHRLFVQAKKRLQTSVEGYRSLLARLSQQCKATQLLKEAEQYGKLCASDSRHSEQMRQYFLDHERSIQQQIRLLETSRKYEAAFHSLETAAENFMLLVVQLI